MRIIRIYHAAMQPPPRVPADRPPADASAPTPSGGATPPRWSSRTLLAGAREAEIEHEDVVYRLRLTSLGKLILTK
jgi:hemin uptake protein HemP